MPLVEILYVRVLCDPAPSAWNRRLSELPPALHSSILRYRRPQDRLPHLFAKLLLKEAAGARGCARALETLKKDANERPFCDAPFDFNISHAAGCAVCAVAADVRVGIDIEPVRKIDYTAFQAYMTDEEWRRIEASPDPARAFFRYWTIKESVMKADGRGMKVPLADIRVREGHALLDQRTWCLREVPIDPGFVCHLATDLRDIELAVRELVLT